MKILLLTSDFPHPRTRHGGGQLTFNWVKHLALSHDLYLLSFLGDDDRSHLREAEKYFQEIKTVPARRSGLNRLKRLPLLLTKPYSVAATSSEKFRQTLKEIVSRQRFDLVQFERLEQVVDGPVLQAGNRILDRTVGGDNNDCDLRIDPVRWAEHWENSLSGGAHREYPSIHSG